MNVGKIGWVCIDPNGYCPNQCWFCPRGWMPNPAHAEREMPLDEVRRLLDQCTLADPVFAPSFNFVSFTHYNEILLYSHWRALLDEVADRKLKTIFCSNGVPLKYEHLEFLADHAKRGTFYKLRFNIPAAEPKLYQLMTGVACSACEPILDRVARLFAAIPEDLRHELCEVQVNLPDPSKPTEPHLLPRARPLEPGDLYRQVELLKVRFPGAVVYRQRPNDRAGLLAKLGVMSDYVYYPRLHEPVVGCGIDQWHWLHINALSQAFLCCSDYEMAYAYADLRMQSIHDAWLSPTHSELLARATQTICRCCLHAKTQT